MKSLKHLIAITALVIILNACGGAGNNMNKFKSYVITDTSVNLGSVYSSTTEVFPFTGDFLSSDYRIVYQISGATFTPTNNGSYAIGDLPPNHNLNDGYVEGAAPYLQRSNGNLVGWCGSKRRDAFGDIIQNGFIYEWTSPSEKPKTLPVPTYRTVTLPEGANGADRRLEGARPVALTASDYLLVKNTFDYPTSYFRLNLNTLVIEPIVVGESYGAIIGEGGQVVTFIERSPQVMKYFASPESSVVITEDASAETGRIAAKVILPNGTVVGEVGFDRRSYWYWVPGGEVTTVSVPGAREFYIMGCSADGTIAGFYFDEIKNREVAFIMRELGRIELLEDLIPGDEKIYRAVAINYEGKILGLRRAPDGAPISIIITPQR